MRVIRILIALLPLSSACLAQGTPLSFVRQVGEYTFRLPTSAFFYQLHVQFCAKAVTDRCKNNLNELNSAWIALDSMFQSTERQRVSQPMMFFTLDYERKRYHDLNEQVARFVETEGMSITTEAMAVRPLGH